MDSMAKCWLMGMKAPQGAYGCPMCGRRGYRDHKRRWVFFSNEDLIETTAMEWAQMSVPEKHKHRCIWSLRGPVVFPLDAPFDPMHAGEGLAKRIAKIIKKARSLKHPYTAEDLNKAVIAAAKRLPSSAFPRRLDSLEYSGNWKSAEARQFLLYIIPMVSYMLKSPIKEAVLALFFWTAGMVVFGLP